MSQTNNPSEAKSTAARQQRKRARAQRTSRAILEAAGRVIERHGLDSTTMELVAREAGYSTGALYKYFKSKSELVTALISVVLEDTLEAMQRPLPGSLDARQRFELLVLRMLEPVERSGAWMLAARHSSLGRNKLMLGSAHSVLLTYRGRLRSYLAARAREAIAEGAVRDIDPDTCAAFLMGVMEGAVIDQLDQGGQEPLTSRVPMIVGLVFDGIGIGERRWQAGGDS